MLRRTLQHCFDLKLQKCFVDYKTSPDFSFLSELLFILYFTYFIMLVNWNNTPIIVLDTTSPAFLLCCRENNNSCRRLPPKKKLQYILKSCFHSQPMQSFFGWGWAGTCTPLQILFLLCNALCPDAEVNLLEKQIISIQVYKKEVHIDSSNSY